MMRSILLGLALAGAVQNAGLDGARVLTPEVKQYEKAEIALAGDPAPANPFDPNAITLDATIALPSGKSMRVPGFWLQDYKRSLKDPNAKNEARVEVLEAVGKPEWRVRFSSGEVGAHRVVLELKDEKGVRRSKSLDIAVKPGNGRGYIRISPRNKTYFEDSAGRAFFPLGQNLCMSPDREGTYFFDRTLTKMATNGGNYVRLWQEYYPQGDLKRPSAPGDGSNTGFPLETVPLGLGVYDLECAWKLDYVSDQCEKLGVYWQICFENVVWWNRKFPHRWKRNPYNAEKGGPCALPADYLTDPKCRELAARRHRYSVARWGWCPTLVSWEMWNEVDNMEGFTPEANAAWHKDLCGRLRALDPWKHPITTSWRDPQMFALPEIDVVQAHSYWPIEYDAAQYTLQDSDHLMRKYGKPFFFGEQGMHDHFELDPEGKVFHDCLWASTLSGAAGAGMHWHWNTYIDKFDLYKHYAPLAKFIREIDWPGATWKPMTLSRPSQPVTLNVYSLAANDRALVWIHDPLGFRMEKGKSEKGPAHKGASVNVVGLPEARYRIEFWNTTTGEVISTDSNEVKVSRHFGHGLELALPEFWGDIAVRIIKSGQNWKSR